MLINLKKLSKLILDLPKFIRRSLIILNDVVLCFITVWFAFYLRLDRFLQFENEVLWSSLISVAVALPVFLLFKVYKNIFRHSGIEIVSVIFPSLTVYTLIYFSVLVIYGIDGVPRTIGIIQPFLLFFSIVSSRLVASYLLVGLFENNKNDKNFPKALIYGAGYSGRQLLSGLKKSRDIQVVGFLDDDKKLIGRILNGVKIFSPIEIKKIIKSKQVTHILLAIPSATRSERTRIIKKIEQDKLNLIIKTLPSLLDIVEGKVAISDIRDLDIEDILGREQVEPDKNLLEKNIFNRVVLVTGAGGSIGQELCKQVLQLEPSKVILLDNNEFALYSIHSEIEKLKSNLKNHSKIEIIPLLGSVQDMNFMSAVMLNYKPDTVYHAAAYKHVPLVEYNLIEGIKNNLFGTINTFNCAIENNISDFVLVSTDKAVRPTNIMGASKRLAELCTQAISNSSKNKKTRTSIVRFGNVIGSSGSVIPKFKKQIHNGGPVTLTHPDVTRFFMSIPEAAQLVIQASGISNGNDLFVLDMGKPIKINDLIKQIIKLSGLSIKDKNNPNGDIEIMVTGLRSGEKLFEELLLGDNPTKTSHPKIHKVEDPFLSWELIKNDIDKLEYFLKRSEINKILEVLKKLVTGFTPSHKVINLSKK